MELKLVYRILRGISDWALASFFSEVEVEGVQHVPERAPVIFAPSHHNEIIDIATLSATAPHRRIISYWAKSSLFNNPVFRSIMMSSGAIPVRRGGTSRTAGGKGKAVLSEDTARLQLYEGTVQVLCDMSLDSTSELSTRKRRARKTFRPGAVGIFPEGTSYTEPRIMQVKEGIAWAALAVWKAEMAVASTAPDIADLENGVEGSNEATPLLLNRADGDLVIIPVGIVYTNKSVYRSRVLVRYGEPIRVSSYFHHLSRVYGAPFSSNAQAAATTSGSNSRTSASAHERDAHQAEAERTAVKRLVLDVEEALIKLTLNSPNWDTLHASRMLLDIIFEGERNVPLIDFVEVSRRLIEFLSTPRSEDISFLKRALIRYHALLYHCSIRHSSLAFLPSRNSSAPELTLLSLLRPLFFFSVQLLHPSTLLFLPVLPLHLPSYILASFAKSYIGNPNEEEARAQLMVVAGGLGLGVGYAGGVVGLWKGLGRVLCRDVGNAVKKAVLGVVDGLGLDEIRVTDALEAMGGWFETWMRDWWIGRTVGVAGVLWTLSKLHAALIDRNLRLYNRLRALYLLSTSLPFKPLSLSEVIPYSRTPRPAVNTFIKREPTPSAEQEDSIDRFSPPPRVSPRRLVSHLLDAKSEAERAVIGVLWRDGVRDPWLQY